MILITNLDRITTNRNFWIRPPKAANHNKFNGASDIEADSRKIKFHILEQKNLLYRLQGNITAP